MHIIIIVNTAFCVFMAALRKCFAQSSIKNENCSV